jgi:hypothetical protein
VTDGDAVDSEVSEGPRAVTAGFFAAVDYDPS